jgi:predicted transglutaminase-like cysteine proteinase
VLSTAAGILAILAFLGAQSTAQASKLRPAPAPIQRLGEGRPVLAPFLHVKFCMRQPDECAVIGAIVPEIEITPKLYAQLRQVNASVNQSIVPESKNGTALAQATWSVAPDVGDCNDFAVTKRHDLIARGFPSSVLILAVVKTASGAGHLVLVVKSSDGDLVLDNLTSEIRPWTQTGHRFLSRQSRSNPQLWVEAVARRPSETDTRPEALSSTFDSTEESQRSRGARGM